MRVTSEFFVAALVRRVFSGGGFAAVIRKGSPEAGAIFITVRRRDGTVALYGPAPQSGYGEGPSDRRFICLAEDLDDDAISQRIERETRFDTDVWFVELDAGQPAGDYFEIVTT